MPDTGVRPAALKLGAIQRRQLCIMFVDLAGSTELAERHDVEDVRELLLAFLEASTARIEAAQGFVARYMGDGILAYFGYPTALAEAEALALHAALEVQAAVGKLRAPDGVPLTARVGIATGEVMIGDVVGRGQASEWMVVGAAANLAARLQSTAAPGTVLVCTTTRELAGAGFASQPTAPLQLKGFAEGVLAWEVTGRRAGDRFSDRLGRGLAPLVGRDAELARIGDLLAAARASARRLVLVGEPGIGKSRLLHAIRAEAEASGARWLATSGAATATATPFFGLTQLIVRLTAGEREFSSEQQARRFVALARKVRADPALAVRIATAAGLTRGPPVADASDPLVQLRADCTELLRRFATAGPLVLAIEDAHWLDRSTRQLLEDLFPLIADLPVLLLATSRLMPGAGYADSELLTLGPLTAEALAALASHGASLAPDLLAEVTRRAQGVPLFAEELARLLGQSDSSLAAIPASLSDLLLSRVDCGEHGLAIAQLVALLGEDAAPEHLAALAGLDPATLERGLDRLEIEAVIAPRDGPERVIAMRHALFGEAAYAALPQKSKRKVHVAAAWLLMERESPDDRIARHFDLGEDRGQAAHWWTRAGHAARRRQALPEALRDYARAIELTDEGAAEQLALHSAQFEVLQRAHGYSASPTKIAGEQLRGLVEAQGDLSEQLVAVAGQWAAASSAGEYDLANTHAARAPVIANALGTGEALAVAAMIQMTARYRCGDLLGAEESFQRGLPHYADSVFTKRLGATAQTWGNGAIVAWLLGNAAGVDQRLAVLQATLEQQPDSYSRTFLAHMSAMVLFLEGCHEEAEAAARLAFELAVANGFPQFQVIARIAMGAAQAGLGDAAGGAATIREGLARCEEVHARAAITLHHAWLAEAELAAGTPEVALGTVTRGLAVCPEERFARPELLRLRALAEAALGREARREPLLREALSAADVIGAEGWRRKILANLAW